MDVDPLVDRAVSDVAERFSGVAGINSSDFLNEAARTSAELGVGAQEAARGRQLEAASLLPGITSARAGLPSAADADLLDFGESINLSTTDAGRQVAGLQLFSGLQPTGAVPRGNVSSGKSKQTSVL